MTTSQGACVQSPIDIAEFEAILLARKQDLLEILALRNANIKDLHASSLTDDSDADLRANPRRARFANH